MNASWPLYMQKQSCRCCAVLPGRWSFPGCSCPVGGHGPTAPPEQYLKERKNHSENSSLPHAGWKHRRHWQLLSADSSHFFILLFRSSVKWTVDRAKVCDINVKTIMFASWYVFEGLFPGRDFISPPVWVWGDWQRGSVSTELEETAIKPKLFLTKANQGVMVTVMDYVAPAVFARVKSFSYCAGENDSAANDFSLWNRKIPPTALAEGQYWHHF